MEKKIGFLSVLTLGAMLVTATSANAALVASCPDPDPAGDNRVFTLDIDTELAPPDASVTCFLSGTGNMNDTEPGAGWTLIEKDEAANNGNILNVDFGTSGDWSIASSVWSTYGTVLIGFKVGANEGAGAAADPDWAIFALTGGALTGDWALTGVLNGLSHATIWGGGTPQTVVPEPASLLLLGTGLLGAGAAARRRRQNKQ